MKNGELNKLNCYEKNFHFICTIPLTTKKTANTTLVRSYTQGQVASVSSIRIDYEYKVSSIQEPALEERRTKPGFFVEWYIRSENGTQDTIKDAQNLTQIWKTAKIVPLEQNKILQRMMKVAAKKRMMNMSRDEIVKEAVAIKTEMLRRVGLQQRACEMDQMEVANFDQFSQVLSKEQSMEPTNESPSQEDKEIGLALYMIVLHCPRETMKLGQFLLQLVKEEPLPSLILAITNTLQSGELTLYHKRKLGRFYQVLNSIFEFSLGKILLATLTPSQHVALQDQELPFLSPNDLLAERCTLGQSCDGVFDHIQG